jgi:tetratricopeptide (TPR) repeat protein
LDTKYRAVWERARAAWEAEDWAASGALYEELLAACPDEPDSPAWWFDAALAYKFLRNWDKAYELGRQAAARAPRGEGDPAFWNLGIAATVLGDWATARDAWTGYGINGIPPGDGPIEADYGVACIRIDTGKGQEVVWARRICPARARILSVQYGDRRYGEIILHDGAPNGRRVSGGRDHPVFDELMLWAASDLPTWRASVVSPGEDDMEALTNGFDAAGFALEPVKGITFNCKCCSEGTIEVDGAVHTGSQDVLFAAPDEQTASRLLDAWSAGRVETRSWRDIHQYA